MKTSIKALAAITTIAALTTGVQAQAVFPDNIDENEAAVTTGSVSTGGSKFDPLAETVSNTFTVAATVSQLGEESINITPTSQSVRASSSAKRVGNREILNAMKGALQNGSVTGYTLVWKLDGIGDDLEAGELIASNPKATVLKEVPVPGNLLELDFGDTAATAVSESAKKDKDGNVIPTSVKESFSAAAESLVTIADYAEANTVFTGTSTLRLTKVTGSPDPVPNFTSNYKGTLAGVTLPTP